VISDRSDRYKLPTAAQKIKQYVTLTLELRHMSNVERDLVIQFNSFSEYFVISANYSSIQKFSFRKKEQQTMQNE
jgi:hypothetical protein